MADEAPSVCNEPEVVGTSPEKLAREVALGPTEAETLAFEVSFLRSDPKHSDDQRPFEYRFWPSVFSAPSPSPKPQRENSFSIVGKVVPSGDGELKSPQHRLHVLIGRPHGRENVGAPRLSDQCICQ